MLHRSFKPAKCKTSLKLATSRLKLMKNKKGVQLNQMKRDLAQLLESGQDQTARIRVEHVIREEKMIAAYELLELYCELIATRLPIIESQKNCPIDLKEAITSVIFASPRCADIAELVDIRKHLTAKYGKEFITAAIELRPNCGVSRMLVEKLSAIAPDGPTKMKVLNAIAEEHNIKWEPKAFGEKDAAPPDDLLNGPNTFEKASTIVVEPPKFQAPPSQDQKHDEPLNFSEHNIKRSLGSQNSASTDTGGIKTSATSHPDARHSGMGSERMDVRQSFPGDGNASSFGRQNWNMEFKDATSAAQAAAESAERASMAARAAAELSSQGKISRQYSSESQKSNIPSVRDEMPGKYASSSSTGEHDTVNHSFHDRNPRFTGQYSSESQKSNIHSLRDERPGNYTASNSTGQHRGKDTANHSHDRNPKITRQYSSDIHDSIDERPEKHAASKLTGEHPAKDSVNNSFHDRNPKLQNEQTDEDEYDNLGGDVEKSHWDGRGSTKRSSRSASLRSSKASIDDDTLVNSIQKGERYSRKSSFEEDAVKDERGPFSSEVSMKKHSRESEVEFVSGQKDGFNSENLDYFGEERIREQFSAGYSRSHSSTSSENYNVSNSTHQNLGDDAAENPFVGIDEGNVHTDTKKTNSYDDDAVAFDESSSDGDGSRFDIGPEYDEAESTSYFPSPGKRPPTHPSTNTDAWSPRRNVSKSLDKSTSQTHFSPEWHTPLEISESSTKSANPSQSESFVPLTFDDSDGPKFDSEDELEKSRSTERMDSSILPRKQNVFSINPEPTQSESNGLAGSSFAERENSGSVGRPWLSSSSDDLDSMEVQPKNNRGTDDLGESLASPPHSSLGKSQMELSDIGSGSYLDNLVEKENHMQTSRHSLIHEVKDNVHTPESPDSESEKELNFGVLRGGLRHKGYRLPIYTRSPSDDSSSSSKKAVEESSKPIERTSPPIVRSSFNSRVSKNVDEKSSSGVPITHSDSDSDDSREELGEQTLSSRKEQYAQKASKEVNTKSIFGPPVNYFDPDSSDDSEEDLPKQTLSNRDRLGGGLSRRTKASPSNSEKSSYSRDRVGSEASRRTKASSNSETSSNSRNRVGSDALVDSNLGPERKPTRSTYGSETQPKPRSGQRGNIESVDSNSGPERKPTRSSYGSETQPKPRSGQRGNIEQPSSEKRASSKPMPESEIPSREGSLKASTGELPSSPLRKTVSASNSTENPKKSSLSRETSTGENSAKNASHVHPKLPDYDTIKAHLLSLRSDRQ